MDRFLYLDHFSFSLVPHPIFPECDESARFIKISMRIREGGRRREDCFESVLMHFRGMSFQRSSHCVRNRVDGVNGSANNAVSLNEALFNYRTTKQNGA